MAASVRSVLNVGTRIEVKDIGYGGGDAPADKVNAAPDGKNGAGIA